MKVIGKQLWHSVMKDQKGDITHTYSQACAHTHMCAHTYRVFGMYIDTCTHKESPFHSFHNKANNGNFQGSKSQFILISTAPPMHSPSPVPEHEHDFTVAAASLHTLSKEL